MMCIQDVSLLMMFALDHAESSGEIIDTISEAWRGVVCMGHAWGKIIDTIIEAPGTPVHAPRLPSAVPSIVMC